MISLTACLNYWVDSGPQVGGVPPFRSDSMITETLPCTISAPTGGPWAASRDMNQARSVLWQMRRYAAQAVESSPLRTSAMEHMADLLR